MKKDRSILLISMLLFTTVISLINLNAINVKGDTPFIPQPTPPNENLKWDFDNDTFIGWQLKIYDNQSNLESDTILKYNISSTALKTVIDDVFLNSSYLVQLTEISYDFDAEEFVENLARPILNCSGVNITLWGGYGEFFSISNTPGSEVLRCTPFIPLNGSTLLLDWCGERLKNDYAGYLTDANPTLTTNVAPDNNMIKLENSAGNGEYIVMYYYDNGTLKTGEFNSTFGGYVPGGIRYNYTRIFNLEPHGVGNYWDVNIGDIIGWTVLGSQFGIADIIYNITNNATFSNPLDDGYDYAGIELKPMYYNSTYNNLTYYLNQATHPLINASLTQYDLRRIEPYDMFGAGDVMGPFANPFIPKNSSGKLDLHWCAGALANSQSHKYFLFGGAEYVRVDSLRRNIYLANDTAGAYVNLTYLADGSLQSGQLSVRLGGDVPVSLVYTRLEDFDPYNEIGSWPVEIGDIVYYGMLEDEYKINIVDIKNITVDLDGLLLHAQQVIANMSKWDFVSEIWIHEKTNATVGMATEYFPLLYLPMNDFPIMVPSGSTGAESAAWIELMLPMIKDFNQLEYGDYWVRIINTTNPGSGYIEFFANGLLNVIYVEGLDFLTNLNETAVIYWKNATECAAGTHNVIINTVEEFLVSIDIAFDDNTLLLFAGFENNSFNVNLDNGQFFFDIMVNATANLNQTLEYPINITLTFDEDAWENVKIMWFNMSGDGGNGTWVEIPYTNLGNGVILISINHTSVFAFTATAKTPPEPPGPPEPPDPGAPIPFGDTFLLFAIISIIGLIFYTIKKPQKIIK